MKKVLKKALSSILSVGLIISTPYVATSLQSFAKTEEDIKLIGTVKYIPYGKEEKDAKIVNEGTKINISTKDGSLEATTDADGKFEVDVASDKRTDNDEYSYSYTESKNLFGKTGVVKEGEANKIYLNEKYKVSSDDYSVEGNVNGYIKKEAGLHNLIAAKGLMLTLTDKESASEKIEVNINEEGVITTPFYVVKDGKLSKEAANEQVKVDDVAPVVSSVSTKPADKNTYVKSHGIYSNQKAELEISASIEEKESGLDKVYIKTGSGEQFEATEKTGSKGTYKISIAAPGKDVVYSETLYIVATDKFGNTSEQVLIRSGEELEDKGKASGITQELFSPVIDDLEFEGDSYNDWFKESPKLKISAQDKDSGLEKVIIDIDGTVFKEISYDGKETSKKDISEQLELSGNSNDGRYTITVTAYDNCGNMATKTEVIKAEFDDPELSITGVETDKHYKSVPSVTIVNKNKYGTEEGSFFDVKVTKDDSEVYTNKFEKLLSKILSADIFSEDGIYKIFTSGKSASGRIAKEVSLTLVKDTTAPVATLTMIEQPNDYGWYKERPSIIFGAEDELSDLKSVVLKLNDVTIETIKPDGKKYINNNYLFDEKLFKNNPTDDGVYNISVVATDICGNEYVKTQNIKVDYKAPNLSIKGIEKGQHYNILPEIKIVTDEKYYYEEGNYFTIDVTRDEEVTYKAKSNKVKSLVLNNLNPDPFAKDGDYKIKTEGADAAGNVAKSDETYFTKDTTAPVVSISGASEGAYYNTGKTIAIEVKERNFNDQKVSLKIERNLNGQVSDESFTWNNKSEDQIEKKNLTNIGTYTITVSSVDKAGNESGVKKLSFTVDTKVPEITISNIQNNKIYTYGDTVAPVISIKDDYLASKSIRVLKEATDVTSSLSRSGDTTVSFANFPKTKRFDGNYTIIVNAKDKSGNESNKEVHFVVNRFGSYYEYSKDIKNINGKIVKAVKKDLVISEYNVSRLVDSKCIIKRDGKDIDQVNADSKSGGMEGNYNCTQHVFNKNNFLKEGVYELNVASKDVAGNEMESQEEAGPLKFTIDNTAPALTATNLDKKYVNAEKVVSEITATDTLSKNIDIKAMVNNKEYTIHKADKEHTSPYIVLKEGSGQKVVITAKDEAGNKSEIRANISVIPNGLLFFVAKYKAIFIAIVILLVAGLAVLTAMRKRGKNNA